jgi:hypothetical protein
MATSLATTSRQVKSPSDFQGTGAILCLFDRKKQNHFVITDKITIFALEHRLMVLMGQGSCVALYIFMASAEARRCDFCG